METARAPLNNEPKPTWSVALIVLVVMLLILTSPCWGTWYVVVLLPRCAAWLNRVPFDSERWEQAAIEDRFDMTWDLMHGRVLSDKRKDEVAELLGKPHRAETFRVTKQGEEESVEVWYYELGPDKYFSMPESGRAKLVIEFSEGRVARVRKVVH